MSNYRGSTIGFGGIVPPTIKILIIVNVAVFLLQQVAGRVITYYFGLIPAMFWGGYIWQAVTYMFLHGGFWHIFFNMFVLWMFGRILEDIWGSKKFLTYYLVTGIGAGLIHAAIMPASPIPTIGASGAVYGILLAFGITFPNQLIYLYFLFPIKAKWLVMGLVVIEFLSSFNPASPVANVAHLGGMVVGFIYLKWPRWMRKVKQEAQHRESEKKMKVVWDRREEMEQLQDEVDELLDKVNQHGLDSLSARERQRLKEASKKLRDFEDGGSVH